MKGVQQFGRWGFGIVLILVVAAIWAGSSVLTQYMYNDLDFKSPFFITYFSTTLFALYLPVWYISVYLGYTKDLKWDKSAINSPKNRILRPDSNPYTCVSSRRSTSSCDGDMMKALSSEVADNRPVEERYTHREIINIALTMSPLWFFANCLYNFSLLKTSVGSSTIISNLSGTFTLIFAVTAGLEKITWTKVTGMAISLAGVVLIGLQDQDEDGKKSLAGDVIAFFAAAFYGLYTTVLRYKSPGDDDFPMQLVLGYLGLINGIFLSPAILVMGLAGWGDLSSITGTLFGFMFLGGIFNNVISDLLWAKSIVLTSPTVATVGLSITIPLAMMSDYLLFNDIPSSMSFTGASLVLLGFFFVVYHSNDEQSVDELLVKQSNSSDDLDPCRISTMVEKA